MCAKYVTCTVLSPKSGKNRKLRRKSKKKGRKLKIIKDKKMVEKKSTGEQFRAKYGWLKKYG